MLVGHAPNFINDATEGGLLREATPSYALRAALALRLAAPRPSWVDATTAASRPVPPAASTTVRSGDAIAA